MGFSRNTRYSLWVAQGHRCGICFKKVKDPHNGYESNIDHVWPKITHYQGYGLRGKLVTHRRCNTSKNRRMPTGCEILFLQMTELRLEQYAFGSTKKNPVLAPLTPVTGPKRKIKQ